jgi:hypothetical protein
MRCSESEKHREFRHQSLPTGLYGLELNPNPAFEKSRFVREGRRTVVV